MATKSKAVKNVSTGRTTSAKSVRTKTGAAKSSACRVILTPTKPSTLGRARIKAAVTKVYGKTAA